MECTEWFCEESVDCGVSTEGLDDWTEVRRAWFLPMWERDSCEWELDRGDEGPPFDLDCWFPIVSGQRVPQHRVLR